MATSVKDTVCAEVGQLKQFLADVPVETPIKAVFNGRVRFYLWRKDPGEAGPRLWLGVDDE